jgi:hypothetical protein
MTDILNRTVKTPAGEAPAVPVLLIALGAYLCWFGVHYWRSDTKYPTDPLKAVLTGQPLPAVDRSTGEAALKGIVSQASGGSTTEVGAGTVVGHSPGAGATATVMTKDQIKALWTGNGGPRERPRSRPPLPRPNRRGVRASRPRTRTAAPTSACGNSTPKA